jgi:hypothetical protein
MLQLIGVTVELVVEGDGEDGGGIRGRVLAIALDDQPGRDGAEPSAESTWLLVADDRRPAPVWVAQHAVSAHRVGR